MSGLLCRIQRTIPTLLLLFSLALAVPNIPASPSSILIPPSSSSSSSSSSSLTLLYHINKKSLSSKITTSSSSSSSIPADITPSSTQSSSTSSPTSSSLPPSSSSLVFPNRKQPTKDVNTRDSVTNVSDSSDVMTVSANEKRLSSAKPVDSKTDVYMTKRARFKLNASEKDKKLLDSVEKIFLKNAGLSGRPKISDEYAVPDYMLDIYKNQVKQRGGPSTFLSVKGKGRIEANTVRSFVHQDVENTKCRPPLCARVHFDVSTVPETETLAAGELRIFVDHKELQRATPSKRAHPADGAVSKRVSRNSGDDKYRLEIHEIMRPPFADGEVISRLLDTRALSTRHNSTWQSFDIHPAIVRWKRGSQHNHGLEIKLVPNAPSPTISTDNHVRVRRSAEVPVGQWAVQRPVLVAFTNDGSTSASTAKSSKTRLRRMRRASGKGRKRKNKKRKNKKRKRRRKKERRRKKGNKNMCSVHKLYVDFVDVGWDDWIVAPPGYRANYCHGDCMAPLPIHTKATNHAMLQARVYATRPGSVPMVCCVPISMSVVSMLYRDEKGRTVLKNYQDMTVERCGCK